MTKLAVKNVLWSLVPIGLGILLTSLLWGGIERAAKRDLSPTRELSVESRKQIPLITKLKHIGVGIFGVQNEEVASMLSFDNFLYPPQPQYALMPDAKPLSIGAVSYVVGDVSTGEIILAKNSDAVFPIASVTKLMTALVSLETLDQEATTKVSPKAASTLSSRGGFRIGERVSVSDLLYPLLLVSSNDAAEVLAEFKGRTSFMNDMNTFAQEIGMEKTKFEDPSGLSANNTSTAKDIFALSTYLENKHRVVFDITMLTEYTALGKVWNNINKFSDNDNFIGGKTGYTDRAKRTGVGIFSVSFPGYEDRHIGIVLLRTDDRTKDIYTILNYLRENVTYGYAEQFGGALANRAETKGSVAGVQTEQKVASSYEVPRLNPCDKAEEKPEDLSFANVGIEVGLPKGYIPPDLVPIQKDVNTKGREVCMIKAAADALTSLYEAAEDESLSLVVTSAYRSEGAQKWLYDEWHRQNKVTNGEEAIAKPGHSEHQLGTTVDFTAPAVNYESAHRSFHLTPEYEWLQNNAYKYGFVLSYPDQKDTGYIFEPWHWRFVGIENSYHMKIANNTVQELLAPKQEVAGAETSKEKNHEVTLSFVGDIMMARSVKTSVDTNYAGDYSKLVQHLGPELSKADIAFGNLEGALSDAGNNVGSKFSFRMDESSIHALTAGSFDILSFANNHVGDWNVAAFNDTRANLDTAGIAYVGAGDTKALASEVKIIEKNGVRVGFLAFSDVGPRWMEAGTDKAGILLASDPDRLNYISKAKSFVDVLVVSYHWGDEYKPHNDRQKLLAESSIDAGADIIVGHHPHVMQDTTEYNGGLIIYSLGNAIFDQYFSEATMKGGLVNATVTKDGLKEYEEKYFVMDKTYVPGVPEPLI